MLPPTPPTLCPLPCLINTRPCWRRGRRLCTPLWLISVSSVAAQGPQICSPLFSDLINHHCGHLWATSNGGSTTYTIYQLAWKWLNISTTGLLYGRIHISCLPMYPVTPLRAGVLESICPFQKRKQVCKGSQDSKKWQRCFASPSGLKNDPHILCPPTHLWTSRESSLHSLLPQYTSPHEAPTN